MMSFGASARRVSSERSGVSRSGRAMFFNLSKIGEFFITPIHAGLFLTAFGVALLFTRFARGGRTLATVGVVALFVMSFSPLGTFLALPLENRFPPPPD